MVKGLQKMMPMVLKPSLRIFSEANLAAYGKGGSNQKEILDDVLTLQAETEGDAVEADIR